MSAPIRHLQRGASRAFSQSSTALISSTSPARSSSNLIASSSSSSARSKKHNRHQKRKKDDILRKAVELYHLTPSFLPSPQQASLATSAGQISASTSAPSWESALDNSIYSSILNTDSVSRRSPNLVPKGLSEFSREQSNRAASAPAFGNTEEVASNRSKDMHSFASDLTSTTFLTRREREAAAADLTSANQSQSTKGTSSSQQIGGGLDHFTDADIAMYQRRHNHAAGAGSSGLDSSRYSGAERLTHLDRITPGANEWYRSQGLDTRSARVRDAIFGTVNGELPGLEVIRERIAKMRRENASSKAASN